MVLRPWSLHPPFARRVVVVPQQHDDATTAVIDDDGLAATPATMYCFPSEPALAIIMGW